MRFIRITKGSEKLSEFLNIIDEDKNGCFLWDKNKKRNAI